MIKPGFAFLLYCFSMACLATETIESVMQRMQPVTAVQIAYQETRYMGLFDDDWQGSGYLYAAIPGIMLKQQLTPEIELMAAEQRRLFYYKPATSTYHQMHLDESNPMMASLVAFRAMLTGNLLSLRQLYQLKFSATQTSWKLEMTAKEHEADEDPVKIIMQGLNDHAANSMQVMLPDGDSSQYVLSQPEQGAVIKAELVELLKSVKEP